MQRARPGSAGPTVVHRRALPVDLPDSEKSPGGLDRVHPSHRRLPFSALVPDPWPGFTYIVARWSPAGKGLPRLLYAIWELSCILGLVGLITVARFGPHMK